MFLFELRLDLEFFKSLFAKLFGTPVSVKDSNASKLAREEQLERMKLLSTSSLTVVDRPFKLVWSISHDEEFEDLILFEFAIDGEKIIHRELATFADCERAVQLASMLREKYGKNLTEICLGPGVGVYIGGNDNSGWPRFVRHLTDFGFDLVEQENDLVKRDGASRELLVPETTFRLRQK